MSPPDMYCLLQHVRLLTCVPGILTDWLFSSADFLRAAVLPTCLSALLSIISKVQKRVLVSWYCSFCLCCWREWCSHCCVNRRSASLLQSLSHVQRHKLPVAQSHMKTHYWLLQLRVPALQETTQLQLRHQAQAPVQVVAEGLRPFMYPTVSMVRC